MVEGINWGFRTIWLNDSNDLVALVQANTQFREAIRKGYEEALPFFIAGNVEEQMRTLSGYTETLRDEQSEITALVGGDVVDGLSDITRNDMTVIVQDGRIRDIGPRADIEILDAARVIDVSGKTLIPGLWDMHAHPNQVQWAPAYLAGGITTILRRGSRRQIRRPRQGRLRWKGHPSRSRRGRRNGRSGPRSGASHVPWDRCAASRC